MPRLLRSLARILTASAVGLFLLLGLLFAVIRQPSLGTWEALASEAASPSKLRSHVVYLTEEVTPRDSEHPENLEKLAGYVRDRFLEAGARTTEIPYEIRGATYRNVVGSFGPTEDPRVIIGAHYDSFGLFGENPGADDNASGTAGLLELARLLGKREPSVRADLVAYPNEEPPYFASPGMGSEVHARHLRTTRAEIWGMISLEMIGYFTANQPSPNWLYSLLLPSRGDFIAVVGRLSDRRQVRYLKRGMRGQGVAVYSFTAPAALPGLDASDHRSYWNQGYRAVMITDTAFLRNPNYHTPEDTADTLDYERMAHVVDGLFNALLHMRPYATSDR